MSNQKDIDFTRFRCPACLKFVKTLVKWGKGKVCPTCATKSLPQGSLIKDLIKAAEGEPDADD